MPRKRPQAKPWLPASYEPIDVRSLQALAEGIADEAQQKRALDFIINNLCGTYDVVYFPDDERDTCFANGKRWPGLQIVKLLKVNASKITSKKEPTEQG